MNEPFFPFMVVALSDFAVGIVATLYSGHRLREAESELEAAQGDPGHRPGP